KISVCDSRTQNSNCPRIACGITSGPQRSQLRYHRPPGLWIRKRSSVNCTWYLCPQILARLITEFPAFPNSIAIGDFGLGSVIFGDGSNTPMANCSSILTED